MHFKKKMRAVAKAMFRPISRRLTRTIEKRINSRLQPIEPIEARLAALENGWRQHLPAFLNAVSTVGAFGYELVEAGREAKAASARLAEQIADARRDAEAASARLAEQISEARRAAEAASTEFGYELRRVWERVEFVRRETLFELKYGSKDPGQSLKEFQPDILTVGKMASAQQGRLKLNLGCGHIPIDGYINVDQRQLPGVDMIADVRNVPIEAGSVDEVYSAHLVEHFPQEELKRRLLPYWKSLLRAGGTFRAVVPDGEAMLAGVAAGSYSFADFREVLFGAQDYSGDFHYNLLTPDSLSELLRGVGFTNITVPVRARVNGKCFEFEIIAHS
jgi:hypothetical protein